MKVSEFVKEFGWEKAREVIKSIPICAHAFNIIDGSIIYYQRVEDWWYWYNKPRKQYDFSSSKAMKYSLDDLKSLVESHDLIERVGGLERAKSILLGCERYGRQDVKVPVTGGFIYIHYDFLKLDVADVEACQ